MGLERDDALTIRNKVIKRPAEANDPDFIGRIANELSKIY